MDFGRGFGGVDDWIWGLGFGRVTRGAQGKNQSLGLGGGWSLRRVGLHSWTGQHAAAKQVLENVGVNIERDQHHGGRAVKGQQEVFELAGELEK